MMWKKRCMQTVCALLVAMMPGIVYSQLALNLPTLGDTDSVNLSPASERILGERIMRDIRQDPSYLQDGVLKEYVNQFGRQLVDSDPSVRGEANFEFEFFVLKDTSLNAFALPGGFIGVHTGLLLAAQNESELASVLSHEIGHVAQRHIARMIGQQKKSSLIQLASLVLGALAATSNVDGAMAAMMGGAGLARQQQLNFSRDAEREADRVGLQILQHNKYDTSGMVAFFERLQFASRPYGNIPSYLSTHPLTTERIADIQSRIRAQRYHQRVDHPDFQLMRARTRVLQDTSGYGLDKATDYFKDQITSYNVLQKVSAQYGLAYVALLQNQYDVGFSYLQKAKAAYPKEFNSVFLMELESALLLASHKTAEALTQIQAAQRDFPLSRTFIYHYAQALIDQKQYATVLRYLREQAHLYRQDNQIQYLLAHVYQEQGKETLQHIALAEMYALKGVLPSALEQLRIAKNRKDATFYDLSTIDARERQLKDQWNKEQQQDKNLL